MAMRHDHDLNLRHFQRQQSRYLPEPLTRSGPAFGLWAWMRALLGLDKSPWENSGPTV